MGQRSQIYIRIHDKDNNVILFAKYFQWNYGERMISRARHGIEYIKNVLEYISLDTTQEKINKIFDINFDMKDVASSIDIIEEVREGLWFNRNSTAVNEYIFERQDNNDGKLFIDCNENSDEIKFCFTDYDLNILSPDEYMKWDMGIDWNKPNSKFYEYDKDWNEIVKVCEDNLKFIKENAKMMTYSELEEFMKCDYTKYIGDSNFIKFLQDFNEKESKRDNYFFYGVERTDDKGSWKLYDKNTKEIFMEYDESTKEILAASQFKESHEGLIQDAYKFYNLPYEKQVIELKTTTENENLQQKDNENNLENDYDYD